MTQNTYLDWFRESAPYIHAHRNKIFIIGFEGNVVDTPQFADCIHDIALLSSLGVKLVVVHGAQQQVEKKLTHHKITSTFADQKRIISPTALPFVIEANGHIRIKIESLLSIGISNSPMHGANIKVSSGNFVTAKPVGVKNGVDFHYTGEVRKIMAGAIRQQIAIDHIVLLSSLGYSPTGEVFEVAMEDVAVQTALAIQADKIIFLNRHNGLYDKQGSLIRELLTRDIEQVDTRSDKNLNRLISAAGAACRQGIPRVHFISCLDKGALIQELYTREGHGTLVSKQLYENIRQADIDDVGSILELIQPLEQEGVLISRPRERIETDISSFVVVERDETIVACAALYIYPEDKLAEIACLVVAPLYRQDNKAKLLLDHLQDQALKQQITTLFALTTQAADWFQQQGFELKDIDSLPKTRRSLYDIKRNSKVLFKSIADY